MDNWEEETVSRNDSLVAFVVDMVVALDCFDYSVHLTCRICIRHFCLCHFVDEDEKEHWDVRLNVHSNEHLNEHLNVSVDAANNHSPSDNETPGHCWLGVYETQPWWNDAYHHSYCHFVAAIPILDHDEVYVEAVGIASAELDLMPFDAMPSRLLLPWLLPLREEVVEAAVYSVDSDALGSDPGGVIEADIGRG